jgi:hypothetical protein
MKKMKKRREEDEENDEDLGFSGCFLFFFGKMTLATCHNLHFLLKLDGKDQCD